MRNRTLPFVTISVFVSCFGASGLAARQLGYQVMCISPCPREQKSCASNEDACCERADVNSPWTCSCQDLSDCNKTSIPGENS